VLNRLKEKVLVGLAWAMPASLAYWVAIRVLTHASCTKLSHLSPMDINGSEAIFWWHESKIATPKPICAAPYTT
jgi:hypothetical protein